MSNPFKGYTGLDRLVRATGHSFSGLKAAYQGESAFRQETWMAVVLIPAAFFVGRTWLEIAILVGSVLLVMVVELLNSAIESAIDRISFELHDLSKRAKDIASAAVFLSLLFMAAIWAGALGARWVGLPR